MKSKLSIVNYQLSIIIILFFALPVKAQVNVGSADVPHSFSILELTTALKQGGLRLPRLSNTDRDKLHPESDPAAAQGLVIYNTDNDCVEFWSGSNWVDQCVDVAPVCVAAPGQPAEITVSVNGPLTKNSTVTYSVPSVPGATSYAWTLPAWPGWSITSGDGTNSIQVNVGTIEYASTVISVAAKNACGDMGQARTRAVSFCGAYVNSNTDWREFMCYNLGVTDTNADPFTPSPALNGDYYQWGYKTPCATYDPDNGDAIVGTWVSTATTNIYGDGSNTAVTTKSPTDPCPDGYRVPNNNEWSGALNKTFNTQTPLGTSWSAGNWTGYLLNNSLFLPASGGYNFMGMLQSRGTTGYYWGSGLPRLNYANYVTMSSTSVSYNNGNGVLTSMGYSVRCIAE